MDERHFVLLTDGIVIYSNFWDWNDCNRPAKNFNGVEDGLCEVWCLEPSKWDIKPKEFSVEELNFIMKP